MRSLVIVEDKDGNEYKGYANTIGMVAEDQLVTVQVFSGRYISGYVVEILKEEQDERPSLKA